MSEEPLQGVYQEFMQYLGYEGSAEVSLSEDRLVGSIINISDYITYSGTTVPRLKKAFMDAVDDYIKMKKQ